jgi:hypothetical protein
MSGNTDSTTAISSYMSGQADKKLAATTAAEIATIPTTYLGETDADKLKIYNENLLEKYSAGCQNGDKSACEMASTIHVDENDLSGLFFGDQGTDSDMIQEGSKDSADHLIHSLPAGQDASRLGGVLKVAGAVALVAETVLDLGAAWAGTGQWQAMAKAGLVDLYKLGVTTGAAAACGGPEDGLGIVCGVAGAWFADKTAPIVSWGIDQLAGFHL